VVRTSAFFGPWDKHNFVTLALQALERGEALRGGRRHDRLADLCAGPGARLPRPADRPRSGIWHLTNGAA
jgi:dTDP-4-dehydrorhamnose reductase